MGVITLLLRLISGSVSVFLIYVALTAGYNLLRHPLAGFPGPKHYAATDLFITWVNLSGRYPHIVRSLHEKYGPVVRTAPNQLSFSSAGSWQEIYGGRKPFLKTIHYSSSGGPPSLVTERNPEKHAKLRKLFDKSFSTRALQEQEDLVHEYVDCFIQQLKVHATQGAGDDINQWYIWLTFDLIGDLAFGEPFGCLKEGKPHFWITLIQQSVKASAFLVALQRIPFFGHFRRLLTPKHLLDAQKRHRDYSLDKVERRMRNGGRRRDFWTEILDGKAGEDAGFSQDQVLTNAQTLIVAGSETTATALSGITYYLCRNPPVYERLVREIRDTFTTYEEINGRATDRMPYLRAVIDEGLRIYPPVPIGMQRYSPGEMVDNMYVPEGTECFTSPWPATRSEENFHNPNEFFPERWLDRACGDKKEASQPFLLGTRVCLGRSLALLEMRITIAKMLWVYDMKLTDPTLDWEKDNEVFTLWQKPELRVLCTPRVPVPGS